MAVKNIKAISESYTVHELEGVGSLRNPPVFFKASTEEKTGETITEDVWYFDYTKSFRDIINENNWFFESGKAPIYQRNSETGSTSTPEVYLSIFYTWSDGFVSYFSTNRHYLRSYDNGLVKLHNKTDWGNGAYTNSIEMNTPDADCLKYQDFTITITNLTTGASDSYTGDIMDFMVPFYLYSVKYRVWYIRPDGWSTYRDFGTYEQATAFCDSVGTCTNIEEIATLSYDKDYARFDLLSVNANSGDSVKIEIESEDENFSHSYTYSSSNFGGPVSFFFANYGRYGGPTQSTNLLNIRHQVEETQTAVLPNFNLEIYNVDTNEFDLTENVVDLTLQPISYDAVFDLPIGNVKNSEGESKLLSFHVEKLVDQDTGEETVTTKIKHGDGILEYDLPDDVCAAIGTEPLEWQRTDYDTEFKNYCARICLTNNSAFYILPVIEEISPGVTAPVRHKVFKVFPSTEECTLENNGTYFVIDKKIFAVGNVGDDEDILFLDLRTGVTKTIEAKTPCTFVSAFSNHYMSQLDKNTYALWGRNRPEYIAVIDIKQEKYWTLDALKHEWQYIQNVLGTHNGKIVIRKTKNAELVEGSVVYGDFDGYRLMDPETLDYSTEITCTEELSGEELKMAFDVKTPREFII